MLRETAVLTSGKRISVPEPSASSLPIDDAAASRLSASVLGGAENSNLYGS